MRVVHRSGGSKTCESLDRMSAGVMGLLSRVAPVRLVPGLEHTAIPGGRGGHISGILRDLRVRCPPGLQAVESGGSASPRGYHVAFLMLAGGVSAWPRADQNADLDGRAQR